MSRWAQWREGLRLPLALLAAALLLTLLGSSWSGLSRSAQEAPRVIPGAAFTPVLGSGSRRANGLQVERFQEGRVQLLSGMQRLSADHYRYLQVRLEELPSGVPLTLLWRSSDSPQPQRLRLSRLHNWGPITLDLTHQPGWRGEILQIGIEVEDPLQRRFTLVDLRFYSAEHRLGIAALLSDWGNTQPWSMRSINFLLGASQKEQAWLTPLVAAWLVTALLFYLLFGRFTHRPAKRSALLLLLAVGWGVLNLHWLANHWIQSRATYQQFSGKSPQQAAAAALDGHAYRLAEAWSAIIGDHPATRLRIVTHDPRMGYWRHRLHYHLLPRNIYNLDQQLHPTMGAQADYLILLGTPPGVRYHHHLQRLEWEEGSLNATLLASDPLATLYRLQ